MDDLSVFRRFFVISSLISELMNSFGGVMGGGMVGGEGSSEADYVQDDTGRRTTAQKYGPDPFAPPVESPVKNMDEQSNDLHGFPS